MPNKREQQMDAVVVQASGPPGAGASADPHYERRWLILLVLIIAQVMLLLDVTVVNVALPSAQHDLGFSDATRQWVITAYALSFGSLLPFGGRLSDVFGRKRMFLTGLIGFAAASALGGAAPNIGVLITARAVQGGFAAVLAPAALSLIGVTFTDPKELNKAFGIFGAVSGSALAVGLLIGGLLTSYVNWRWCMYVNIAFAAAGIIGGLALLHHVSAPDKPRLSVPSTVIGSAALFGVVFGAATAQTDGWGAALTVGPLVAGGALLGVFAVVQRYDRSPLIPLRVLADRNRGAAYLVLTVANAAVFAVFLFLTYYFQDVLHYSPIKAGLAFLPLVLVIAVVATITQGPLLKVATMRVIVTGGLLLCGAGAALLTKATAASPYAEWVLLGLVLQGAGIGSATVVAIATGQQGVAPRDAGTAGAMNNVSQQVGGAIGVALISTFVAASTASYLHGHAAGPATAVNATVHGFATGFWWAAGIDFAGAVILGVLIRPRTRLNHDPGEPNPLEEPITAIS